jgi:outer membrane cobalamin receptor
MGSSMYYPPATRSRFFILQFIVAFILLYSHACFAQSDIKITGQVVEEESGIPVPGATIILMPLGKYTVSDQSGIFYFCNIPDGQYELSATRIGFFESKPVDTEIKESLESNILIALKVKPIDIPDQRVTSSKISDLKIISNGNVTSIDVANCSPEKIESIISQVPELELVESGPQKLIRFRGSQFNAVTILLDGRVQNSLLSSEGDISLLPLNSIKRIEITRGGDYKSAGLAGSVNFITKGLPENEKITSSVKRGSFDYESYSTKLSQNLFGSLNTTLDIGSSFTRGDFQFFDPRDSLEIRENNYAHDLNLLYIADYSFENSKINFRTRYFDRNSGIPGPIFQPTPEATSKIREKELCGSFSNDFGRGIGLNIISGISSRKGDYDSPSTPSNFIPYKTSFNENSSDIQMQFQVRRKNELDFSLSYRHESLNGKDIIRPVSSFGQHSRNITNAGIGTVINLPVIESIYKTAILNVGVRRDGGSGNQFWGPSASLRINLKIPASPGLDFSAYRTRRLPDLTDLFWKEDLFATPNPDLKPEISDGFEVGIDIQSDKQGLSKVRTTYFITDYNDLIIWRKWGGDKYKPLNLSKAEISGIEISLNLIPFSGPFTLYWNASFIKPLNKEKEPAHFNKYLTFRPVSSQNTGIEFKYSCAELNISGHHIGRRFTTEENTKSLPSADIVDTDLSLAIKYNSIAAKLSLQISNLTNKQYEIIDRQPERPREYIFSLEISKWGKLL